MSERAKGITVDQLDNVRVNYEQGTIIDDRSPHEQAQNLYPHDAGINEEIHIWKGDITTLEVDCIVNAANKSLLGGGGVDGAIHSAAGPSLRKECLELNGAETGETKLTSGYLLPALRIAHTVGPVYSRNKKGDCERLLRNCYKSTLDLCSDHDLKSVAFSGISTGIYGYPLRDAARVACDEVRQFLQSGKGEKIEQVIFCNFRSIDVDAYVESLPYYFPPPPRLTAGPRPSSSNENSTSATPTEFKGESHGQSLAGREDAKDDTSAQDAKRVAEADGGGPGKKSTVNGRGQVPGGKASPRQPGKQTHGVPSVSS